MSLFFRFQISSLACHNYEGKYIIYLLYPCHTTAVWQAANPGCVLEDFVRWHSPPDWTDMETEGQANDSADAEGSSRRGRLSARMQKAGEVFFWQVTVTVLNFCNLQLAACMHNWQILSSCNKIQNSAYYAKNSKSICIFLSFGFNFEMTKLRWWC